jgi:hypothetical protein
MFSNEDVTFFSRAECEQMYKILRFSMQKYIKIEEKKIIKINFKTKKSTKDHKTRPKLLSIYYSIMTRT